MLFYSLNISLFLKSSSNIEKKPLLDESDITESKHSNEVNNEAPDAVVPSRKTDHDISQSLTAVFTKTTG